MVKGLNFPHGLSLVLQDADGNEQTMFMGYLNFDGWKELSWDNPAYVQDVRNRELRVFPLYPNSTPMVKFGGFVVTRDGANQGGDFVTYIKDVKSFMTRLSPIQLPTSTTKISGELSVQEGSGSQEYRVQRFGSQQVLRYLEKMKQETKAICARRLATK